MYMIEITEDKMEHLYENIEKGLKYLGKAMQCVEELKSESGHREDYDDDEYDERERHGDRSMMRMSGMKSRRGYMR